MQTVPSNQRGFKEGVRLQGVGSKVAELSKQVVDGGANAGGSKQPYRVKAVVQMVDRKEVGQSGDRQEDMMMLAEILASVDAAKRRGRRDHLRAFIPAIYSYQLSVSPTNNCDSPCLTLIHADLIGCLVPSHTSGGFPWATIVKVCNLHQVQLVGVPRGSPIIGKDKFSIRNADQNTLELFARGMNTDESPFTLSPRRITSWAQGKQRVFGIDQ